MDDNESSAISELLVYLENVSSLGSFMVHRPLYPENGANDIASGTGVFRF
jgi:hypothetical protein